MSFDLSQIYCGIFFGLVGFSAWRYGRQQQSARHMLLAVGLMSYSYFVSNIWLNLGLGGLMTLLLFFP